MTERTDAGGPSGRAFVVVVAVVVLAGVPAVLWFVGARAIGQVSVTSGVPQCTGTQLVVTDNLDGLRRQAIPVREGFRCSVMVQVTNESSAEVRIERIAVSGAGPLGGAGFTVSSINGTSTRGADESDAIAVIDESVPSGDEVLIEVFMDYRDGGCISPQLTLGLVPMVEVTKFIATDEVPVADFPLFVGTADTSCDE